MTTENALYFVTRLAILKSFPPQSAYEALAEKLVDWCRGTGQATPLEQAAWLVAAATELDEYPGPGTLHRMLTGQFYPEGAAAPLLAPYPSEIVCRLCRDSGTIQDSQGLNSWCTCEFAAEMRRDLPGWLDTLNLFRGRRAQQRKVRLTDEEFESRVGL